MTDHTWTAADSAKLHTEYLRMKARELTPTSISGNISVGNMHSAAFAVNIARFIRQGMDISWDGTVFAGGQTHYHGFYATGDYENMRDFYNWYRGFFHMA